MFTKFTMYMINYIMWYSRTIKLVEPLISSTVELVISSTVEPLTINQISIIQTLACPNAVFKFTTPKDD